MLKLLEANPNYSKFLELVRKANLTQLLSNNSRSLTLLVPKNDVFEELSESGEGAAKPSDPVALVKTPQS